MGALLSRIGLICSRDKRQAAHEVQEPLGAKVRELEAQLLESRQALLDLERDQLARAQLIKHLEQQLEQTQGELANARQVFAGLRHSIETANAPIISVNRAGYIQDGNSKAKEIFGHNGHAKLPPQLVDIFHRDDRPSFLEFHAAVLAAPCSAHTVGHLQKQFRGRSQTAGDLWQDVLMCASPCHNAEGMLEGALYIGHDLTENNRERLEAQLTAEELQQLIRTVNALIIGVDQNSCVDEWNCKAELLTGYTREEALGKVFIEHFVTKDSAESVQAMLAQAKRRQKVANFEFSLLTKGGQRRELLWSGTARRNRNKEVSGVLGVGQDITELRSESNMLSNYVRICGAAVWSLRGNAMTGAVTDNRTKEIEHLISQQAQMDIWDPRVVLWRACFVSILKTMCQNFWMRRKGAQCIMEKAGGTQVGPGSAVSSSSALTTDFVYEFSFEAPNGSVKWYKVHGLLVQEFMADSQFEVTGSMQEVTSMLIDKWMGDRWQKWWNRMCHMVFDATLLVDSQEYRVLNAWGEEKVFGCKLQSNHPLLHLIKHDEHVYLKEAFNEVTFKGFERGRTLHLLKPGCDTDVPAHCFLLSADQEAPNEFMMGIRMQVSGSTDAEVSVLWDVAKPNPVLTLEDLARLKSGLKKSHRRPSRNVRSVHRPPIRSRSSDPPHTSSHSLSSIPEDWRELENETLKSSSKSSNSSNGSNGSVSEVVVCNSSPARSASDSTPPREGSSAQEGPNPFALSPKVQPRSRQVAPRQAASPSLPLKEHKPLQLRIGPAQVNLRWCKKSFDLNLDDFSTITALRAHLFELTGVPTGRQTLILSGRRLPPDDDSLGPNDPSWSDLRASVRPGQTLMLVGSAAKELWAGPSAPSPGDASGVPAVAGVGTAAGAKHLEPEAGAAPLTNVEASFEG